LQLRREVLLAEDAKNERLQVLAPMKRDIVANY